MIITREQIESYGWRWIRKNAFYDWFFMGIGKDNWTGEPNGYYGYPVYGMGLMYARDNGNLKIYFNFGYKGIEWKDDDYDRREPISDYDHSMEKMFDGECLSIEDFEMIQRKFLKIIS